MEKRLWLGSLGSGRAKEWGSAFLASSGLEALTNKVHLLVS